MPETSPQPVVACVFDAYGTVFDVAGAAVDCRDVLGDKVARLVALWREKQLEYSWLRSLMGDFVDFWHVTGHALDHAMAALGIADDALRARLMQLYLRLAAYPDVKDMLGEVQAAGIRTALLSNGSRTMLTAAVSHAGLHDLLDAVLSVDAVGVYKPHPSVYRLAEERLLVERGRLMFFSANAWDVAGAARFGLRSVWVNRTGRPAEHLPGKPEHEIAALGDVPRLLGL